MLGTPVETLKELNLTAQKAAGVTNRVHFFRPEGEPDHVYLIATFTSTFDGTDSVNIERHEAAPSPRVSDLQSVRSIPEAIATLRQQLPAGAPAPIVWYSEGGITVELDRRQRIHYEWSTSAVAAQLQSLPAKFDPKNLRKWLRVAIGSDSWSAGCQQLYDALAVLKFNVNRETRTQVGNGRESLGRDLDARVGSEGNVLPEAIILNFRLTDDPAIPSRQLVTVDVDIDAVNGTIELSVCSDGLRAARDSMISGVVSSLSNDLPEDVKILCGQPDASE